MTYSNKEWMNSKIGFHIKYAMPPDVFLEKFWPKYHWEEKHELKEPDKTPDIEDLKASFAIDYYGKYLESLCKFMKTKDVEYMGACIRAKDSLLKETGPVVLWKGEGETLTCENLRDEHFRDFEKAIVNIFGTEDSKKKVKSEDFGFSVCIFVTEDNESPSKAKICIGAKIDEHRFIETIDPPKEIKDSFLAAHKYVPKVIKYQKESVKKPKTQLTRGKH